MGCDIHIRVEYKAAAETVVVKDNDLAIVPTDQIKQWTPAEKLTSREDSHGKYFPERDTDPEQMREFMSYPMWEVAYEDRWYGGRDYGLFANLAGVRGEGETGWGEKGFPDDASPEVTDDYVAWGMDAHTPSHQTLTELRTVDWVEITSWNYQGQISHNTEWIALLDRLEGLAIMKCDGDFDSVRIVYWFDN